MIIGKASKGSASTASYAPLDELLRRAAEIRPRSRALSDAPNRPHLIGGDARHYSWSELDTMVDALAGRFRQMGLTTDAVVATQFAMSSDAVIALLAVLRAGCIAAPMPLGWGRREITAYLQRLGARAVLTAGRIGTVESADMMRYAAAETFSVRFVMSLGGPVLDGVIALDDVITGPVAAPRVQIERTGVAADHVAVITADAEAEGHIAVARSHNEMIAGGLAAFVAGLPDELSVFAGALAPDGFAGIALQIVPWLMSGGTLVAHPPLAPRIIRERLAPDGVTHAVVPLALGEHIVDASLAERPSLRHLALLARRPASLEPFAAAEEDGVVVDIFYGFGEAAIVRGLRKTNGSIALGPDNNTSGSQGPVLVETRVGDDGQLALRGAMVPTAAFPPGSENWKRPFWFTDADGFRVTGMPAAADKAARTVAVGSRAAGVIAIGGRRFAEKDIRAVYAETGGEIAPVIRPDPLLGDRVAGIVGDGRAIVGLASRLVESGLTPLAIPGGTRQTGQLPFEDTRPKDEVESVPAAASLSLDDAEAAISQLLSVARSAAGY